MFAKGKFSGYQGSFGAEETFPYVTWLYQNKAGVEEGDDSGGGQTDQPADDGGGKGGTPTGTRDAEGGKGSGATSTGEEDVGALLDLGGTSKSPFDDAGSLVRKASRFGVGEDFLGGLFEVGAGVVCGIFTLGLAAETCARAGRSVGRTVGRALDSIGAPPSRSSRGTTRRSSSGRGRATRRLGA